VLREEARPRTFIARDADDGTVTRWCSDSSDIRPSSLMLHPWAGPCTSPRSVLLRRALSAFGALACLSLARICRGISRESMWACRVPRSLRSSPARGKGRPLHRLHVAPIYSCRTPRCSLSSRSASSSFHARAASSLCLCTNGLGSSEAMSANVWLTSRWCDSSA